MSDPVASQSVLPPPMTYYIIALSDDHPDARGAPLYWCGYVAEGRTHSWLPSPGTAIRFLTHDDALRAGVSGPNVPNPGLRPQPQLWPNRGIKIVRCPVLPIDTQDR